MYNNQPEKFTASVFTFSHSPNVTTAATIRIDPSVTRFLAAIDGTASTTAGDAFKIVMTRKGVLKNLFYKALLTSTLTNATHKFTVFKNGAIPIAPEGLSAFWNPATKSGNNLTGYIDVLPGDVISVQVQTFAGTGAIIRPTVSFELEVENDYPSPWDYDPASKIISYTDGDVEVDGIIRSNAGFQFPNGDVQTIAFLGGGGSSEISESAGKIGIGIDPSDRTPQEKLTLAPDSNLATEMPIPDGITITPISGGNLTTPDDYFFKVAASDGTGWTKASDVFSITLTGANKSCKISWDALLGAVSYKIYRSLILAGPYQSRVVNSNSFVYETDAGFSTDIPQDETTAYINKLSASGTSWILGGNVGIGTTGPTDKLEVTGNIKASGYKSSDGSLGITGNFNLRGGSDVTSANQPHFISWIQASPPGASSPTGDFISNNLDDVFGWHCSPCTMPVQAGIDFGVGYEKTIQRLRVNKHVNCFNAFSVQGSNNSTNGIDGTWTSIFIGNMAQPLTDRTWEEWAFGNSTAYRWYRLNITSQYTTGWAVYEWELLEGDRIMVVKNGIVTAIQ